MRVLIFTFIEIQRKSEGKLLRRSGELIRQWEFQVCIILKYDHKSSSHRRKIMFSISDFSTSTPDGATDVSGDCEDDLEMDTVDQYWTRSNTPCPVCSIEVLTHYGPWVQCACGAGFAIQNSFPDFVENLENAEEEHDAGCTQIPKWLAAYGKLVLMCDSCETLNIIS
jgi:hypothetical protein